jgi:hypothetical protein
MDLPSARLAVLNRTRSGGFNHRTGPENQTVAIHPQAGHPTRVQKEIFYFEKNFMAGALCLVSFTGLHSPKMQSANREVLRAPF